MISAWVFVKIGFIVLSITAGLIFFYISGSSAKSVKKQQLEESVSLIINFVLFIWAAKILLNISIFVSDPLAVLAYPSDSNAFYAAVLILLINIAYRVRRKNSKINAILSSLVPIFLGSAFVYEFIEVVFNDNMLSWVHLGVLLIVSVFFLIIHDQRSAIMMTGIVFAAWSLGQLILTFLLPYTSLYGYMMSPWFLILVFIMSVTVLIYNRKRVKS